MDIVKLLRAIAEGVLQWILYKRDNEAVALITTTNKLANDTETEVTADIQSNDPVRIARGLRLLQQYRAVAGVVSAIQPPVICEQINSNQGGTVHPPV